MHSHGLKGSLVPYDFTIISSLIPKHNTYIINILVLIQLIWFIMMKLLRLKQYLSLLSISLYWRTRSLRKQKFRFIKLLTNTIFHLRIFISDK